MVHIKNHFHWFARWANCQPNIKIQATHKIFLREFNATEQLENTNERFVAIAKHTHTPIQNKSIGSIPMIIFYIERKVWLDYRFWHSRTHKQVNHMWRTICNFGNKIRIDMRWKENSWLFKQAKNTMDCKTFVSLRFFPHRFVSGQRKKCIFFCRSFFPLSFRNKSTISFCISISTYLIFLESTEHTFRCEWSKRAYVLIEKSSHCLHWLEQTWNNQLKQKNVYIVVHVESAVHIDCFGSKRVPFLAHFVVFDT